MVSESVLDHGHAVVVENPPSGELELSVTRSGVGVVTGRPDLVPSVRLTPPREPPRGWSAAQSRTSVPAASKP